MAANPKPERKQISKIVSSERKSKKHEIPNKEVRKTTGRAVVKKLKSLGASKSRIHEAKAMR